MSEEFSTKDGLRGLADTWDCPNKNIARCQKKRSDIAKKVSEKTNSDSTVCSKARACKSEKRKLDA